MQPSSPPAADGVWTDLNLATMSAAHEQSYAPVRDAALLVRGGRIEWLGPRASMPHGAQVGLPHYRAGGRWATPGLIDCHTHLVYAGSRAQEFEMRLGGASYEEIARRGGGIVAMVEATRKADEHGLYAQSLRQVRRLLEEGVTTIEIKSGYGLDLDTECKMLRVARTLGVGHGVDVKTTFLGAHALPAEFKGRADDYIGFVCREVLPAVAREGLADAVDVFCERIGITAGQTERVFESARALGLPVKLHAEPLSDCGGAALAARFSALSADHLEYVPEAGVKAMAAARTVAVPLPGAFYFLRETGKPPVALFRKHRLPIALATDSNPGSSPATSLLLMLNMGCTLFGLTPEEALAGVTRNAAAALGIADETGTLEVGKCADFVLWDIERPGELAYGIGANPCHQVVKGGAPMPSRAPGRAD